MPTSKDYYEILGVSRNATDDQIKQAYRRLAREHHPDVVKDGDKSSAEARFKEINEAYQVLSDSQKRKKLTKIFLRLPEELFKEHDMELFSRKICQISLELESITADRYGMGIALEPSIDV